MLFSEQIVPNLYFLKFISYLQKIIQTVFFRHKTKQFYISYILGLYH